MKLIATFAIAFLPTATVAATYTLSGSQITSCVDGGITDCSMFDGVSLDGEIRIKGRKLGGLAFRNLVWEVQGNGESVGLPLRFLNIALPHPILSPFTLNDTFRDPKAGSRFELVTGERGQVVDWSLAILDGPPDYILTPLGLEIYAGGTEWSGTRGTLTRGRSMAAKSIDASPVPIPAGGLLLLGGLGMLAALRRSRG